MTSRKSTVYQRTSTGRCILGVVLANLGLAAWSFGMNADVQVWTMQSSHENAVPQNVGLLGFKMAADGNGFKYTLQQEEYFVDLWFTLARYLYFASLVLGLVLVNLLLFSAWPTLSSRWSVQHRWVGLLCCLNALTPIAIFGLLYISDLCNGEFIQLEYNGDHATTATLIANSTTTCVPDEEAGFWLLLSSGLWFLCSVLVICTIPKDRKHYDNEEDGRQQPWAPLLTHEPLLDPPARTLGLVAKLNTIAVFALIPYWTESALIRMSPQLPPFRMDSGSITHTTQILGPHFFNPPQDIPYNEEQQLSILDGFHFAMTYAWLPLLINLFGLPIVLCGRHRLTNGGVSVFPYFLLALIFLVGAGVTVAIPASVILSDLCQATRYPEFLFDESDNEFWMGTGITYHSTIDASCWPNSMGQILLLGAFAFVIQAFLLIVFCIQYYNAQDTLQTFAGIEEDQMKLLASREEDSDDDEEESAKVVFA